jgi:hypothetical protein
LENFLTTLRELYQEYKESQDKAMYSVCLVGIRNITKLIVGGVSPFNIADQVRLPPFSLKNVRDLYAQYTAETNQPFTPEAVKVVHAETAGQPWLVNRLGTILSVDVKPETTDPITEEDAAEALEQLTEKYLLPEKVDHGYIVLFDPKTKVGELCTPQKHVAAGKEILIFNIAIGRQGIEYPAEPLPVKIETHCHPYIILTFCD